MRTGADTGARAGVAGRPDMPLPGPAARFDYQSFDPTTGHLWIAHMGAGEVLAFDVRTRRVVARVPNMPGVTGVLANPTLQRVFAALSAGHAVAVLDAQSGRVLARIPGGRFPDGLAYVPAAHKLYVSDEYGRQELVIDVPSSTARPPIAMGAEVGNTNRPGIRPDLGGGADAERAGGHRPDDGLGGGTGAGPRR